MQNYAWPRRQVPGQGYMLAHQLTLLGRGGQKRQTQSGPHLTKSHDLGLLEFPSYLEPAELAKSGFSRGLKTNVYETRATADNNTV